MDRRQFLAYAFAGLWPSPAIPDAHGALFSGKRSGDRFIAPAWEPVAGQIRTISYAARAHPLGRGAVLSEISPSYYDWNPDKPNLGLYGIKRVSNGAVAYSWGSVNGFCGASFNTDTRQIVCYGGGHASANACAPFCFDLNDLRWKWLDTPLPFDGYARLWFAGAKTDKSTVMSYYTADELDYDWGEVQGGYSGYGAYARPGVIQPVPGHSRGMLVHLPAAAMGNAKGALLKIGQATGVLSGIYSYPTHTFDYDTARWSRGAQRLPNAGGGWRATRYDPVSNKVIMVGSANTSTDAIYVWDVATRTYSLRYTSPTIQTATDHGANVLHEASGLYIVPSSRKADGSVAGGLDGVTFRFFACPVESIVGTGAFAFSTLTVDVDGAWPLNSSGYNLAIGWAYCPADKCLYTINGEGGSNKYWRLSPPPNASSTGDYLTGMWTMKELIFASGTNSSSGRSWVYNRLSWDRKSRSFVFHCDAVSGPVQAFRPEGV